MDIRVVRGAWEVYGIIPIHPYSPVSMAPSLVSTLMYIDLV